MSDNNKPELGMFQRHEIHRPDGYTEVRYVHASWPTVRFKRLHVDAVAPTRAHPTDAGYDLTAFSREYNAEYRYWEYGTGIAVEIPEGFVGLLFPRSSISKTNLTLANSVGVIDASYRGEVKLRFREAYRGDLTFPNLKVGERCGQLVIMPIFAGDMVEADELSETPRGEGGFGSTGSSGI